MRKTAIAGLVAMRESSGAAAVVLTAHVSDPTGYGRIVRDRDGEVAAIVEQKDATSDEVRIDEVNTGTYCFDARVLLAHLDRLDAKNAQGEYYLTDIIELAVTEGVEHRGDGAQLHAEVAQEQSEVSHTTELEQDRSNVLSPRRCLDVHQLLGVTDEHAVLLGVEQPAPSEVGQRMRQRLAGRADHLGQFLLRQVFLDPGQFQFHPRRFFHSNNIPYI